MHLSEADRLIRDFSQACEQYVVADNDRNIVTLTKTPPLPVILPLAISDAIHNMRAALDYIVFELARYDSGKIQNGTQFPIEDVKVDPIDPKRGFDARSKQYLRGLNPLHIGMIEGLQPYKGVEWTKTLRDISNPDKHRTLTVLTSEGMFTITTARRNDGTLQRKSSAATVLECKVEANNAIMITLTEGGETPLMSTLRGLEAAVSRTIELFKPEFKI